MDSVGMIVVGASAGGLTALGALLKRFPADFGIPIAIVQHRSAESNGLLARELRRCSHLRVLEPADKETVSPGCAFLAPADYHLLLESGEFRLSTEGPVNFA